MDVWLCGCVFSEPDTTEQKHDYANDTHTQKITICMFFLSLVKSNQSGPDGWTDGSYLRAWWIILLAAHSRWSWCPSTAGDKMQACFTSEQISFPVDVWSHLNTAWTEPMTPTCAIIDCNCWSQLGVDTPYAANFETLRHITQDVWMHAFEERRS